MRSIFGILFMISVIFGSNFYLFHRLWNMMPVNITGRVLLICFAVFTIAAPVLSMFAGEKLPIPVTSFLYKAGTSWIIIMMYLVIIFLLLDFVRITHIFNVEQFMYGSWRSLGILAILITIIMAFGFVNYKHKNREELTITIDKNTNSGNPLKIVAISDLHLGYGIGIDEFRSWVQLINKEEPDILLIAGDLIDNSTYPLYKQGYAEVFKEIRTKYGIYMSLGNHEYIFDVSKSINFLNEAGITLLRDSVATVNDEFYIVGRDDMSNPDRKTIARLTESLDKSKPVIMLDHQPYNLDEVEKNGIDLQISGHTHNGQIWPISLVTKLIFEKSHGYIKKGDSHIYVSSGIGLWGGKFRIGTNSEYAVILMERLASRK